MEKTTKDAISKILDEFQLNEDEKTFLNYSNTASTEKINHSRIISTFLLAKQLNRSTNQIIKSNKLLAIAENRNSKKMQCLTWALIGVGALQAFGILLNLYVQSICK